MFLCFYAHVQVSTWSPVDPTALVRAKLKCEGDLTQWPPECHEISSLRKAFFKGSKCCFSSLC